MSTYCSQCGTNTHGSNFCSNCGYPRESGPRRRAGSVFKRHPLSLFRNRQRLIVAVLTLVGVLIVTALFGLQLLDAPPKRDDKISQTIAKQLDANSHQFRIVMERAIKEQFRANGLPVDLSAQEFHIAQFHCIRQPASEPSRIHLSCKATTTFSGEPAFESTYDVLMSSSTGCWRAIETSTLHLRGTKKGVTEAAREGAHTTGDCIDKRPPQLIEEEMSVVEGHRIGPARIGVDRELFEFEYGRGVKPKNSFVSSEALAWPVKGGHLYLEFAQPSGYEDLEGEKIALVASDAPDTSTADLRLSDGLSAARAQLQSYGSSRCDKAVSLSKSSTGVAVLDDGEIFTQWSFGRDSHRDFVSVGVVRFSGCTPSFWGD